MTPVLVLNVGSSSSTGWTAATGCSPPVSWSGSGHGLDAVDVAEWTWQAQTPSEGRRALPAPAHVGQRRPRTREALNMIEITRDEVSGVVAARAVGVVTKEEYDEPSYRSSSAAALRGLRGGQRPRTGARDEQDGAEVRSFPDDHLDEPVAWRRDRCACACGTAKRER